MIKCVYCQGDCIKKGKTKKIQRYQCKSCKRYQQAIYKKQRITEEKYDWVRNLNNEGSGISNISRLLHISKSSVQRVIIRLALSIKTPVYQEEGQRLKMNVRVDIFYPATPAVKSK